MNWVDLAILVIVGLFTFSGFRKGAIRQVLDALLLFCSVFLAVVFYDNLGNYLAAQFTAPEVVSRVVAFFLIFAVSQFLFGVALLLLYPLIPKNIKKSEINKILGTVPGFLWGVFFIVLVVIVLLNIPTRTPYISDVRESASGQFVSGRIPILESTITDLIDEVLERSVTFRTVSPGLGETSDLGFTVPAERLRVDEQSEKKMLELVNRERAFVGLRPLRMDADLTRLARAHSKDMFIRGYFSHVNPDGEDPFARMSKHGIDYRVAGENLALAPNVELAHEGLMNSPGHRANILTAEFGLVGIGCIDGGRYGKMFTQKFTN